MFRFVYVVILLIFPCLMILRSRDYLLLSDGKKPILKPFFDENLVRSKKNSKFVFKLFRSFSVVFLLLTIFFVFLTLVFLDEFEAFSDALTFGIIFQGIYFAASVIFIHIKMHKKHKKPSKSRNKL